MQGYNTENVLKFLKVLASTGNVTRAAESIGFTRSNVYAWRKSHQDFAEAWDDAVGQAMDELEEVVRKRAIEGPMLETVTKSGEVVEYRGPPSDNLAKFLLTVHRYKDTELHEHQHTHILKLTDAQLEAIAAKAINSGEVNVVEAPPLRIPGERHEDLSLVPVKRPQFGGAFTGAALKPEPEEPNPFSSALAALGKDISGER